MSKLQKWASALTAIAGGLAVLALWFDFEIPPYATVSEARELYTLAANNESARLNNELERLDAAYFRAKHAEQQFVSKREPIPDWVVNELSRIQKRRREINLILGASRKFPRDR